MQCAGRSRWILSAPRSSPAGRCSPAKAAACAALSRPGAVPPQRAAACAAPLSSGRCSSPRHRAGCSAQAGRAGFYPRRAPPRPGAVPPQRPPPAPPSPGRALLIPAPSHRTQCAERSRLILPTPHAPVMSAAAPVALPASVGMPGRPLCSHRPAPRASPIPGASPSPAIARYCRRPRQPGRCSLARGRRPRRPPPARTLLHPPPSHRTQCAERSRLILPTPHAPVMSAAAPVALPASVGMPGRPFCPHRAARSALSIAARACPQEKYRCTAACNVL